MAVGSPQVGAVPPPPQQQQQQHTGAPSRGVLRTPFAETKLPDLGIHRHGPWVGQVSARLFASGYCAPGTGGGSSFRCCLGGLLWEGPDPDLRWLLICAGNVELNPGPGTGSFVCGVAPRSGQIPLTCSSGCGAVCHRQRRCSGLSRARQGNVDWTCGACAGSSVPS